MLTLGFLKKNGDFSHMEDHLMNTLKDVKVGKSARVVKVHGEGAVRRRIMDMGITKGVEIYVRKLAPLGDPIEMTVRGY
jgi:ferrous iron transport protein A